MCGTWMPVPSIHGGSYQHDMEFHRAGLYGSLTGKEEVKLTLIFLLDDLSFQVLDGLGMSPLE